MSEQNGNYAVEKQTNPFGEVQKGKAGEQTSVQREATEVQAQVIVAQQFPRDPKRSMDKILNACTRPGLAENAVYDYAKGGSPISGPTIRLAECIAQNWGNVNAGIREVEQSKNETTMEAFAWDLETNTRISKRFHVPHKRHTNRGDYQLTDPREIYENNANQGARRLRACILSVIPGDVTEQAVAQCETTMQQKEELTDEKIKKMVKTFHEDFGISQEAIEKTIQRRVDSMTPALMSRLRKIYNSLKDGMSMPSDWFDVPTVREDAEKEGDQDAKSKLQGKVTKEEKPADNKQEQEPAKASNPTATVTEITAALDCNQNELRDYCASVGLIDEGGKLASLTSEQRSDLINNAEKHQSRLRDLEDNE